MSDLVIEQRPSRRLWTLAGLGALALHIGCAGLVIAHLQTDDPEDSLGAPAIEIGLEMMAPRPGGTHGPAGPRPAARGPPRDLVVLVVGDDGLVGSVGEPRQSDEQQQVGGE